LEPQTHKFTLEDRDGKSHEYVVTPTPPKKAYKFVVKLSSTVGQSLAALIADDVPGLIKRFQAQGFSSEMMDIINGYNLGLSIERIADVLGELDPLELFEFTWRDGKRLASEAEFNAAFARNYGELRNAQFKVGEYNDFLGYMLGSLQAKMKKVAEAEETPTEHDGSAPFIER